MSECDRSVSEQITPYDAYVHQLTTVHAEGRSAYQEWLIAENPAFGRMLVLDGVLQSTEADEFIYHEGIVHPAMLAVGLPRRVLVLGGGEGATAREVLRWSCVERVDMVDIDAEVVTACREHLPRHHQGAFDDPRLRLHHDDAVAFLARSAADPAYDVVISDMTDPVDSGPSTFCFTQEYFKAVDAVLAPGGIVTVQAGPVSPVEISLHAKVIRTLRSVYPSVAAYSIDAPCYSRPLGFVMASREGIRERLAPEQTSARVDSLALRWLTARGLHGRLEPPPYLVAAIDQRADIYTASAPPSTGRTAGWEG